MGDLINLPNCIISKPGANPCVLWLAFTCFESTTNADEQCLNCCINGPFTFKVKLTIIVNKRDCLT